MARLRVYYSSCQRIQGILILLFAFLCILNGEQRRFRGYDYIIPNEDVKLPPCCNDVCWDIFCVPTLQPTILPTLQPITEATSEPTMPPSKIPNMILPTEPTIGPTASEASTSLVGTIVTIIM